MNLKLLKKVLNVGVSTILICSACASSCYSSGNRSKGTVTKEQLKNADDIINKKVRGGKITKGQLEKTKKKTGKSKLKASVLSDDTQFTDLNDIKDKISYLAKRISVGRADDVPAIDDNSAFVYLAALINIFHDSINTENAKETEKNAAKIGEAIYNILNDRGVPTKTYWTNSGTSSFKKQFFTDNGVIKKASGATFIRLFNLTKNASTHLTQDDNIDKNGVFNFLKKLKEGNENNDFVLINDFVLLIEKYLTDIDFKVNEKNANDLIDEAKGEILDALGIKEPEISIENNPKETHEEEKEINNEEEEEEQKQEEELAKISSKMSKGKLRKPRKFKSSTKTEKQEIEESKKEEQKQELIIENKDNDIKEKFDEKKFNEQMDNLNSIADELDAFFDDFFIKNANSNK